LSAGAFAAAVVVVSKRQRRADLAVADLPFFLVYFLIAYILALI
jgi:hypothetical protein